ncbi:LOW QUALITY PROTEIN: proton-associated sugar transporter A [Drosophila sulfurigaster albostrigata]|uniref:LOW QUALITY PROTEIN: proton-associated sugar transporter A n=1 Tax=Drosophila sulfurigaster albostrigata TaxID=89887 RepID=UPI002D218EED|nr:LOW QUALITY PROTEIN: proton-associated sugar transporter A [Drosophila sulfurigaster albostrigata]
MEKLHEYQGITGRIHQWRDNIKESYGKNNSASFLEKSKKSIGDQLKGNASANADYSHIYRHKTRAELVRVSAAVMGIEFSYAAETAFVSPTLLKIGVEHQHMTLVWALSPLVGFFFLCPILGSLSDRCKLNVGRRRPFIILLSVGVLLGLILVPNGENLGYWFGDIDPHEQAAATNTTYNITYNYLNIIPHKVTASKSENEGIQKTSHPWGIFFTVLGTVLLDFDADACQSPSRAYLLDVCIPEDHARGLSTFTIMAGLGGFFGYSMGGLNWDETEIGRRLGGHVKAVFTIITFIFITCVTFSISSFTEIPLWVLSNPKSKMSSSEKSHLDDCSSTNYGAMNNDDDINHENIEKSQICIYWRSSFYCLGMTLMALTRTKLSVILFSWTAGVMYSTLFTMPYLLVAHYHSLKTFELDESGCAKMGSEVRGLGTDVAIISSMVFLAQFLLSICMGTIVKLAGTTTAVITTASFF